MLQVSIYWSQGTVRQKYIHRPTWIADRRTVRHTDTQRGRQRDRKSDRYMDRPMVGWTMSQSDRLTDRQTDRQTDWLTDPQTKRHTYTDEEADSQTNIHSDRQRSWQTDRHIHTNFPECTTEQNALNKYLEHKLPSPDWLMMCSVSNIISHCKLS